MGEDSILLLTKFGDYIILLVMKNLRAVLKIFWWGLFFSTIAPMMIVVFMNTGAEPIVLFMVFEYTAIYSIVILFMNLMNPDYYYESFKSFRNVSIFVFVFLIIFSIPYFIPNYNPIAHFYIYFLVIIASVLMLIFSYFKVFKRLY